MNSLKIKHENQAKYMVKKALFTKYDNVSKIPSAAKECDKNLQSDLFNLNCLKITVKGKSIILLDFFHYPFILIIYELKSNCDDIKYILL